MDLVPLLLFGVTAAAAGYSHAMLRVSKGHARFWNSLRSGMEARQSVFEHLLDTDHPARAGEFEAAAFRQDVFDSWNAFVEPTTAPPRWAMSLASRIRGAVSRRSRQ